MTLTLNNNANNIQCRNPHTQPSPCSLKPLAIPSSLSLTSRNPNADPADNPDNQVAIAQAGGIPAIIAAIKNYPQNGDMINHSIVALRNIASNFVNVVTLAVVVFISPSLLLPRILT